MNKLNNTLYIVSLSGGLDSFVLTHKILSSDKDNKVMIIHFEYNQNNQIPEKIAFHNILKYLKSQFPNQIYSVKYINISSMFNDIFDILYRELLEKEIIKKKANNHKYYVPSRNLLFITISSVIGEMVNLYLSFLNREFENIKIALGIHKHSEYAYGKENTNYWDITKDFANRINEVLRLNNVVNISLYTPFVDKTKKDIIKYVYDNRLPYKLTWTCYNPIKIEIDKLNDEFINNNKNEREELSLIKSENKKVNSISDKIQSKNYILYKPCLKCEACKERYFSAKQLDIFNLENEINDYQIIISKSFHNILEIKEY